jgi:hypothetical protein
MLFNDTLHSGHWSKVQFGAKQKFSSKNYHHFELGNIDMVAKTQIRIGTGTFLENIVVQPKTF